MLGNASFRMSSNRPFDARQIKVPVSIGRGDYTINNSFLPKPYTTLIPCKVEPKPEDQTPSLQVQITVDEII